MLLDVGVNAIAWYEHAPTDLGSGQRAPAGQFQVARTPKGAVVLGVIASLRFGRPEMLAQVGGQRCREKAKSRLAAGRGHTAILGHRNVLPWGAANRSPRLCWYF